MGADIYLQCVYKGRKWPINFIGVFANFWIFLPFATQWRSLLYFFSELWSVEPSFRNREVD